MVLAPQCPTNSTWIAELDRVEALVQQWRADDRVDPRRVYLTGLSMGGFGSWALAARQPDWFAAVVPICGGGDPTSAPLLVDVPIWAVHGDADSTVPVEESQTMVREIQRAGRRPRYSELKGGDHDSWTPTYRADNETIAWMYRQQNDRCQDCN
ncbi:MAG: hypothetical protein B7Z55_09060 [Planctomycetales bacterium 12-60-4]|nr:MAG: hypothetical protein B7Z55_09060 [Planctomycetales bacterium 12-60-4]